MPVEIRELVIRAVIDDDADGDDKSEKVGMGDSQPSEAFMQACVQQVLAILKSSGER